MRQISDSSFHWHHSPRNVLYVALPFLILLLLATGSARAQSYTVLHNFTGGSDGESPFTGLTLDSSGHLYGTAFGGGSGHFGTVFSLETSGSGFSTLYAFQNGQDGAGPIAQLAFGPDGALYGSTSAGGGGPCLTVNNYRGCGTLYRLSPPRDPGGAIQFSWTASILYRFSQGNSSYPQGQLAFDASGNIYGIAVNGGAYASGVIYSLTPTQGGWTENTLYQVRNDGDGQYPWDGVIFDRSGNLYGIFTGGGPYNYGAVFKLAQSGSGWEESTIHGFSYRGDDGAMPEGGPILDNSGNLYGSTSHSVNGGGVIYELTTSGWSYDYIEGLSGGLDIGPYDRLVMDSSGNLYGTTFGDGQYGMGSVFKLTRSGDSWIYQSLHNFSGGSDGNNPMCSLVIDSSGNLYGTTSGGGTHGGGLIFKITP